MQAADYAAMPRAAEYVTTLSAKDLQADAACSGWLRKRSEHVKQWNKRWFVLWPKVPNEGHGRLLVYYSKPNDERARGCYRLNPGEYSLQTEQTKKHKVCLVLTTNKPNKWDEIIDRIVLSVDDVEKAVDWARAINSTGIAAQKKERKAPPTAQLGGGLGNIIEECDEDEEEDSGSEIDDSDGEAASSGESDVLDAGTTPPSLAGTAGVQEGIPPLLLASTEPEPEPELLSTAKGFGSGRLRLLGSKAVGGSLDETVPVRVPTSRAASACSYVSNLDLSLLAQRLSPTKGSPASPAVASTEGGDKAFAQADGNPGPRSSKWRKTGRRGVSEGDLLEERRPSISVTGLDYNAIEEKQTPPQGQAKGQQGTTSTAGTPRQAVPVLGLKPWNADRGTSAPIHLNLQIAKELETLDWSPGAARRADPAGAASTGTGMAFASSSKDGAVASRSASAPETLSSLPPPSLSPTASADASTFADGSPATVTAGPGADGSGDAGNSSTRAGGTGRTLAAALRSSIGGSTPENKALQSALLKAGSGDVRSVLQVMSEHVNGVNSKLREMESERLR